MFDPSEVAALRLSDTISGDQAPLPPDLVATLQEHFDEVQLAEIILVCGQANLNNRAGNAAKQLLGPDEPRSRD